MRVDKENEYVSYNDELHKYWLKSSGEYCVSATTLIHKFATFDEDFWSSYKAFERIAPESFKGIKKTLLKTKRIQKNILEILDVDKETFKNAKKEILAEWALKRDESCVRGTKFHNEQEAEHWNGNTNEIKQLGLGGSFPPINTNKVELGKKGVYPEILLSRISNDKMLKIAGQADLVIVDGNEVHVLDYKTSKAIDKKAYFDTRARKATMMKYPLNNIEDSNFWHYTLQLSLYAWMIEKEYPEAIIKSLTIIHYDHDGKVTNYECEYRKKDVERMLAFYKNQLADKRFKESIKKITF
ncbi:MAG: PD-(D/E)XK nuclease family protein [Candidatus Woesearchaeota archaeon]|nr:PD-(D/E)XK nuclease family protein [Candidatus Woesearchaeota archaeon]